MAEKNIDQVEIPNTLPLLPVKDVVLFPSVILPLFVGRESSIQAVDTALAKDRLLFLAAQKDMQAEVVTPEGQYWPEAHTSWMDGVAHMKPAGHPRATVVPTGQYFPELQAVCVEGVVHTEPRAHWVGAVVPCGQNCPEVQFA